MPHTNSSNRTRAPAGAGRDRASFFQLFSQPLLAPTLVVGALLWGSAASAQTCPSNYTACDNTGCCLSSEQCCPTLAEGCCSSATPFCCGDGTCAVTPSECGSVARADCDGYDVPCGGGCAPAGSDCCDLAGHYCPPESMCTSGTACVRGAMPTMALEVEVISEGPESGAAEVAPPFADPAAATERSCNMLPSGAGTAYARTGWLVLAAGLVALCRRRGVTAA